MAASEASYSANSPVISDRALKMPRSSIRRLYNAAKALQDQGVNVARLDIGDPDFAMPERMSAAIKAALDGGRTHYSPMPGVPELRQAIAAHVSRKYKLGYGNEDLSWERVICTQGATQALNSCFQLTCTGGDRAILPEIYFPNLMQQVCLSRIEPLFYGVDGQFQPRLETLAALPADGAKVMIINSPSNPTGAVLPPATIRALYDYARRHNLWIVSDEAYWDFAFDGELLSPLQVDWEYPEAERRVLGVFTFSKSYAATGLRLGWIVSPNAQAAQQLAVLNEPLTGSLTTPLQYGMLAALAEDDTLERRDMLRLRRDRAVAILAAHGINVPAPQGGIFLFFDISRTGLSGDEFADALLAEERVAVVPGSGFGLVPANGRSGEAAYVPSPLASRCIRMCFARPAAELETGALGLAAFIARKSG